MDNLLKALRCEHNCLYNMCEFRCRSCDLYQSEYAYKYNLYAVAADKIEALQKSNRNWRRKVQRSRKQLKEANER